VLKHILLSFFLIIFIHPAWADNVSPQQFKQVAQQLTTQAPNINTKVLSLALKAYYKSAKKGLHKKQVLTVIDYNLPSDKKRLWVFDMQSKKLKYNTLVSHGKNSGSLRAYKFSDVPNSKTSSIGTYLTKETYHGANGYSLRLKGLEEGFNGNAEQRYIVMHGAWYVSQQMAAEHGRIGRSWGCPAVPLKYTKQIINTIKGGSIIFAYYPHKKWLNNSQFLA
jgi:hypothetical protein